MSVASAELSAERSAASQVSSLRTPEIRIYGHSSILYWWPVWLVGFVIAAMTFVEGSRAVIVPAGATYDDAGHAIVLPDTAALSGAAAAPIGEREAASKNQGVVFTTILLLVVFITNTPLRGLWSAIAVLVVLVATLTLAWLGMWSDVLAAFGRISIHMNLGFYVFFSGLLFLLWAAVVFVFDRMHYWKFRPGQLTYESWFGGGQKSYDTSGMLFEKLRDDPFRHWVLGLGSGDLRIKTSGAQAENILVLNVLRLNSTLRRLQQLVSERPE
ncbi:MAG TPA: hypothetical protein VGX78_12510 [Pirellulales bacterium]|nr:hypothetical protein [Pirellulales bacterium]